MFLNNIRSSIMLATLNYFVVDVLKLVAGEVYSLDAIKQAFNIAWRYDNSLPRVHVDF